ncbi:hypothetical protein DFH06DRAFT_1125172 [Mycena polygramma]|nr:hypothetical protein DFH06DRAFT_1125172 [Mycena polygramma]
MVHLLRCTVLDDKGRSREHRIGGCGGYAQPAFLSGSWISVKRLDGCRYIPAVEVQVERERVSASDFDEEARRRSVELMHHTSGLRITPPSPRRFTPWTALGGHYDPPSYSSATDLSFPSPESESETVYEEIQRSGINVAEYAALHPDEPHFRKATQAEIYDFNFFLVELPTPAQPMPDHLLPPRHFVMWNEATSAFYPGLEVESFGTLTGNWTLSEIKLRKKGFVYVQWVETRKKQLAVIHMPENSYHKTGHLHQQEQGSRRCTVSFGFIKPKNRR